MRRALAWIGRRPLAPFAAGVLAGIAASDAADPPAWLPWVLLAAPVAALAALIVARAPRPLATIGVLWLGAQAGFARHEWAERLPESDVARRRFDGERAVAVGRVVGAVRIFRDAHAPLDETDERHADLVKGAFAIELESLLVEGRALTGRVRVQFYEKEAPFREGALVRVSGKLRTPRGRTNPGGYDRRRALLRQGIGAVLTVSTHDELELVAPPPASWSASVEAARESVRERIRRHARPDAAAFLSALVLGFREDLPAGLVADLQRSGTAHFLAISGQNLVLLLGILLHALFFLGLRGRKLNLALIALLFVYASLTGWPVSVTRAFLMAACVLAATVLSRRNDTVSALSLAAAGIALVDPAQAFDPGFHLSFLAVLGIIGVSPVFHDFFAPPDAGPQRWLGRLMQIVRAALAVSVGAWLATAPIVLWNFNLMTPVILIANLALFPLMFVQMILGLAIVPFAYLLPPAASAIGAASGACLDAMAWVAETLTRLPGSYFYGPSLGPGAMAAYYGLLAVWTAWCRRWPGPGKPWACAFLPVILALPAVGVRPPADPELTVLDVGRGSAAVLRLPDGRVYVVDAGSISYRDAGASVVAPYLWSRRITRVDALVLTHADADHVNGARSLMERIRVGALAVSRYFGTRPEGAALLEFARSRRVPVEILGRPGAEPEPAGDGVEALGPPLWERYGRIPPENECSVVLRIAGVLFPGDVEEAGVEELLTLGPALRTRVLVAPHHGKFHERHAEFADAVAPEVVVVSAPEGYYSPRVVERLAERSRVFITGRDGAVVWTIAPRPP